VSDCSAERDEIALRIEPLQPRAPVDGDRNAPPSPRRGDRRAFRSSGRDFVGTLCAAHVAEPYVATLVKAVRRGRVAGHAAHRIDRPYT
jgi:hypothetical protein